MERVRTAIVGLGYFGPNLLRNFAAQSACDMVLMCDLSEERLTKLSRLYPSVRTTTNLDDVAEDASIDLILIATPTSLHFPIAKKMLEAGKHVFIEKPMTSSVAEAEELVALAKQKGKLVMVDHTFAFAPSVQEMTKQALDGSLGELLYFDSVRINLGLIQKDTNVLFDLAIHDLSILATFMDLGAVRTVCAHGSKHFGAQEEQAHLHLTWANGFTAHIHVSWLSPVKIRQTMIAGTKSMIIYDDVHPSEKIRIYDRGVEHDTTNADPFFPKYRSGDVRIPALSNEETLAIEARHVLACIQGKEAPRVSGEEALKVLNILELANKSMHSDSSVITLP